MNDEQKLLQISAKLFQQLESVPKGEKRDNFIEDINLQLDERGRLLQLLNKEGFQFDEENKFHQMLGELDKGIRKRLNLVMDAIKDDMKNLQKTKKNEKQYTNPYSSVRVMDGMYYDKKK